MNLIEKNVKNLKWFNFTQQMQHILYLLIEKFDVSDELENLNYIKLLETGDLFM